MKAVLTLLVACGLCWPGWAQDKPTVTWMVADQPPASMPINGRPTNGVLDVLWKLIVQRSPEVQHQYVVAPTARALTGLAEGREACVMGLVLTAERERIAYFSETHFGPPLQLITRSEVIRRLPRNAAGEVLPGTLFDRQDLHGLLVRNRSYSPHLDALLNQRGNNSAVAYVNNAEGGANVFKMIALKRADYTLDYDFTLAYQLQRESAFFQNKRQTLVAVPVAGSLSFASGIACPRTPWGRQAILKIDSIVAGLATNKEYQESGNRWLTPQTVQRYRKDWEAFFRNRERLTDPQRYAP